MFPRYPEYHWVRNLLPTPRRDMRFQQAQTRGLCQERGEGCLQRDVLLPYLEQTSCPSSLLDRAHIPGSYSFPPCRGQPAGPRRWASFVCQLVRRVKGRVKGKQGCSSASWGGSQELTWPRTLLQLKGQSCVGDVGSDPGTAWSLEQA